MIKLSLELGYFFSTGFYRLSKYPTQSAEYSLPPKVETFVE